MVKAFINEDNIEQAVLDRLAGLGYQLLNCYTDDPTDLNDGSDRADKREVILKDRLAAALQRLNPELPQKALDQALQELCKSRRSQSLMVANREIDGLVRDGIQVEFENDSGRNQQERVKVIDWNNASTDGSANEFLAISQLWIRGDQRFRRPDILLYINGLPLVYIELKNSTAKLRTAYDDNLLSYKEDIPQLFICNAFCVFSNVNETRLGSLSAKWEHFFQWLRIDSEKECIDRERIEKQGTSIEYALKGLCEPARLLDYIENFILYYRENSKIIAQNHQFIGVNNAYAAFGDRESRGTKLGVFWHTQGSGKSFSMIFYVRKIFRKLTGNFTFVVVTDRTDLDGQIYRNFLNTATVNKGEAAQPGNSTELRKVLGENKRLVFSLIQKFRYDKGKRYPVLSERDDIVVIVDEAHRSQYQSLAENMRAGLPHARYIAFTGTPLLGSDRKTNAWFGEYVSEYNFQQSMDDGATVPLFYEKRVPEVLIQNEELGEEFYALLEDEELDEEQQIKFERKYAREMEVIKRDDRLDTIARDIVYHFPRRGYLGKAMMITLDKFTAVKMYDKVQYHWREAIKSLRHEIAKAKGNEKKRLKKRLEYMRRVEMAVVISEEAGEAEKFSPQKLDIKPHRERMNAIDPEGNDIEHNFKDPEHPLQLVFVCAMWLTGFDAPTISTLYLDKPMKDHSLMQTIARANRVSSHVINETSKENGEIIDYYNVFRNMNKALRDYAQGNDDVLPVQEKSVLFTLLDQAIEETVTWCAAQGIDLSEISQTDDVLSNIGLLQGYADILLANDERCKTFKVYQNTINGLYDACKPELFKQPARPLVAVLAYLRGILDTLVDQADVDAVQQRISDLLDDSLLVDNNAFDDQSHDASLQIVKSGKVWDLSKVDYDQLKDDFQKVEHKHLEIADLRAFIEQKLQAMLNQNQTRTDFIARLQVIIDRYNSGASATENYFEDLMDFNRNLHEEDERHIREELTEDELEIFDLLKKEKLCKAEKQAVKLAAQQLLKRLKEEQPKVLVQDWFKDSQSQAKVRSAVEEVLDATLPKSYETILFQQKCDQVYDTVFDYSSRGVRWAAQR